MPGMNGMQAARAISSIRPEVVIVALSGDALPDSDGSLADHGIVGSLQSVCTVF